MNPQNPQKAEELNQKRENAARLERLRTGIDDIDDRILELINRRGQLATEIARLKRAEGKSSLVPHRESQILDRLKKANLGPLPNEGLTAIFREIISACRGLQGELKIAYLGPEHSFSHQAVFAQFGRSCQPVAQATIGDVFEEVERGHVQVGLVPVENSTQGGVGATLDMFVNTGLKVCGEVYTRISLALMSREKDLDRISKVYSHPQALNQCRDWLRRNLPAASLEEESSTAAAAERVAEEPGCAAVGSIAAADIHGLEVLARDIQDLTRNVTRFLVISLEDCPPSGSDKTSLLFITRHQPGALHRALGHLADKHLNLTLIESRPTRGRPWEYAFFVDFMGHHQDAMVSEALAKLQDEVGTLKVLGSYPSGKEASE